MKPRQTIKNIHHTNASPYQNQNSSTNTTIRDIDLIKFGLNPDMMPYLQAPNQNNNPTTSGGGGGGGGSGGVGGAHTSNIMGTGVGSSSNVDSSNNNRSSTSREEIMKCLNAIYGKNSADILQNLPALNDWPMQSVSPPDYPKASNSSVVEGSSLSGNNIGTCFTNTNSRNINNSMNCNPGQQQKKDIQYNTNNNHQQHSSSTSHPQQTSSSVIANHFRMSTSSTHSPQQQHLSQQQQQQQKSVLSHQHQHHHQNDLSNNRRLNHHLSTTNTSFTNLNSISNASKLPTTSNLHSDSSSLAAASGSGIGVNLKNSNLSNIMDSMGQGDNNFYDNSLTVSSKEISSTMQQQPSLTRHQQLQNLLKATGSSNKLNKTTSNPSSGTLSSSSSSHRNDLLSKRNSLAMSSSNMTQHLVTSQQTPTISPPHAAFTSVPKSLLNLAACSSTTSNLANTPGIAPKISSMVGHSSLKSTRNSQSTSIINNVANINIDNASNLKSVHHKSNTVNNSNDTFSSSLRGTSNINDQHSNMIHMINRSATSTSTNNNNYKPSRHSKSSSLLLDDSSTRCPSNVTNNPKVFSNIVNVSNVTSSVKSSSHIQKTNSVPQTSKEAYIANLQERAAKAGISIGEINPPIQLSGQSNNLASNSYNDNNLTSQQNIVDSLSPINQARDELNPVADRKEIESALSRVEARNDLSLLYPPVVLGPNSQKQINALSAGLHNTEDPELFTDEIKRIVLEECNIIYECKECNNLFRSLANLVKHKRTYCPDYQSSEKSSNPEAINKSSLANNLASANRNNLAFNSVQNDTIDEYQAMDSQKQTNLADFDLSFPNMDYSGDSSSLDMNNIRGNQLERRLRMMNMVNERKEFDIDQSKLTNKRQNLNINRPNSSTGVTNISTPSTSLSKLLQSQPKNRLPVSRDSALVGALNMTTNSAMQIQSVNSNLSKALSAFKSDNIEPEQVVSKQLLQNSSLAKTLLNEKAIRHSARQLINQRPLDDSSEHSSFTAPSGSTKRVTAPKRKFLEDCIKKVKRDKCLPGEAEQELEENQGNKELNKPELDINQSNESCVATKFNSPLESDDSDMLMIDLDEPKRNSFPGRRGRRRASTAASSTASSSASSIAKHPTSSALLKALTKPVDTRKATSPLAQQISHIEMDIKATTSTEAQARQDEFAKVKSPDECNIEQEEKLIDDQILSPLFDNYVCDICGEDQKDLTSLTDHTIDQHRGEKMIYPCIFCSLCYITLENVCRHIIDIHKKPKTQVYRLKEVVRSRSYLSSDFSSCSDHPQVEATTSSVVHGETQAEEKTKYLASCNEDQPVTKLQSDNEVSQLDTDNEIIKVVPSPHSNLDDEEVEIEDGASFGNEVHQVERFEEPARDMEPDGDDDDDDIQVEYDDDNDKPIEDCEFNEMEAAEESFPVEEDMVEEEMVDEEQVRPETGCKRDDNPDFNVTARNLDVANKLEESSSNSSGSSSDSSNSSHSSVSPVLSPEPEQTNNMQSKSQNSSPSSTSSSSSSSSSPSSSSSSGSSAGSHSSSSSSSGEGSSNSSSNSSPEPPVEPAEKLEAQPITLAKSELAPQLSQTPSAASTSSTNNPTPEASSSTASGGGIMKLKIQLKTRPDEKSKVYEIV